MFVDDDIAYHRKEFAKADEKLLAGYIDNSTNDLPHVPYGGN